MRNLDLTKTELYESVKQLVDLEGAQHILLPQSKLFTLTSIAFQYLLFRSTKRPGIYIIRVEDSALAEKITKKAKDPTTRKFMASLLIPRKLKYGNSTFYLDFFNISSWNLTKDLPREKIQGALIVKNTSTRLMNEPILLDEEDSASLITSQLPEDYYFSSLAEFVPKTLTVAFETKLGSTQEVTFPFIKTETHKTVSGVKILGDIDLESVE